MRWPSRLRRAADHQLLKNEFNGNLGLLDLFDLLADLGYLGLVTDYDLPPQGLPHRKPRRSKKRPDAALSDAQRAENTAPRQGRTRYQRG